MDVKLVKIQSKFGLNSAFTPFIFREHNLLCLKNMIDKEFYCDGLKNGHKN